MFRRLLQVPGLKRNPYNRPQDRWTCGRAAEGCVACPLGPTAKGACQATGECVPVRQGDRWQCTRSDAAGGKCGAGPLPDGSCCRPVEPCVPRRSLRAWRGRATLATVSMALGGVLLFFTSSGHRDQATSPGHLSSAHSAGTMRCADCHDPKTSHVAVAFAGTDALHERAMADSRLCLECHSLGPDAFAPHGRAAPSARENNGASGAAGPVVELAKLLGLPPAPGAALACQTCHTEHRGLKADIRAMSDQQCQVCHQETFSSFGAGHPEFDTYPYERRTRIRFDHVKHLRTHFMDPAAGRSAPAGCASCHESTTDGRFMLVKGFGQTCASCHGEQIAGASRADDPGVAVLRIPGLDTDSLRAAGLEVGEWPRFAEGRLTPFMEVMLATRPGTTEALETLRGVDWLDLDKAPRARLEAAATVAWGIKELWHDLLVQGQDTFLARAALGGTPETRAQLVAGLPLDALVAARQAWFPTLMEDVAARRAGLPPPSAPTPVAPAAAMAQTAAKHAKVPSGGDDLLAEDDLLAPDQTPPPAKTAADMSGGDDLLAGHDPLVEDQLLTDRSPGGAVAKTMADDDLLGGDDLLAGPDVTPVASDANGKTIIPTSAKPAIPAAPDAWTVHGGWYRQEATYTLHYRPVGHADPFLKAWLDLAGGRIGEAPAEALFQDLSREKAPGLCVKCHAVDATETGQALQWKARRPDAARRGHTVFSHRAHFALLDDRGCQTCHTLDDEADYLGSFMPGKTQPSLFVSNFRPLAKSTCASCHASGGVSDACLTCHGYHTGVLETVFGTTKTNASPPPPTPQHGL